MAHLSTPQYVLWGVTVLLQCVLVSLLISRRSYRAFPWFTTYVVLCIGQSLVVLPAYFGNGFSSPIAWRAAWISQGFVFLARGVAVGEICRKILRAYRGIWELAWRLLLACALLIAFYAFFTAPRQLHLAVLAADRGLELAIAVVVVFLSVFARYYRVPIPNPERTIAVGFCLYSCSFVLDNSLLKELGDGYGATWSFVASVALIVSLLLWVWTLWVPVPRQAEKPASVAAAAYSELSPAINLRLRMLNEQLLAFWRTKVPHL